MSNWTPSTTRPGYRCKTIKQGNATIIISRPILTEAEAAQAQEKTRTALEGVMRDYYARTARLAAG